MKIIKNNGSYTVFDNVGPKAPAQMHLEAALNLARAISLGIVSPINQPITQTHFGTHNVDCELVEMVGGVAKHVGSLVFTVKIGANSSEVSHNVPLIGF